MFYPPVVGAWTRQAQQNPQQWVYKWTNPAWNRPAFDHLTLQLARAAANADCDGDFHYTTRGTATRQVAINGPQVVCNQLVYAFDYKLNLARKQCARSGQANHNKGRYPKRYVSDVAAAQPIFGAPKIENSQTLKDDFDQVDQMRDIDGAVNGFWSAFPATRICVYSPYKDDSGEFEFEVQGMDGTDYGKVSTDGNGLGLFLGATIGHIRVRCPRFFPDWAEPGARASYGDSAGRYSVSFA